MTAGVDDGMNDRSRLDLQRIAVHVAARRRHDVTGRFGLRLTTGGVGTPMFGELEVVRLTPTHLVHEAGAEVRSHPLAGATLGGLAAAVGVDLAAAFSVGHDTPPVGDVDLPLLVDARHVAGLADWLDLGGRALDLALASADGPATVQLWPEHFDLGTNVAIGSGADDRLNLGVSPGDGYEPEPYLYVGPWGGQRPGDGAFWNAPFGAVVTRRDVTSVDDALAFFRAGLARFASG